MNPHEVLAVMTGRGAIQRGHFKLSSGKHSDVYVQKFRVLEDPALTTSLGAALEERFRDTFDCVAAPAIGAIVLGFATALAADSRSIFAERSEGKLAFRRGFEVRPHERVLVVEDVVTTGGSAQELVDVVVAEGGQVAGVASLLDRTDPATPPDFGVPFVALARLDAAAWEPDVCRLCRDGVPVDDPGSRRLA